METKTRLLDAVELETGPNPRWSVIWLHGLGADGNDFAPIVPELVRKQWPAMRFVFPHAPVRPVTVNNGASMRAWYDIVGMDFPTRADSSGVNESIDLATALIEREHERGVGADQVFLAGFSQGGAIALAAALRRSTPLAGVIALSTYLPDADAATRGMTGAATSQPVFMAHGSGDTVIPLVHAQRSKDLLQSGGVDVNWHVYPMAHQVCAEEIRDLGDWMAVRLAAAHT